MSLSLETRPEGLVLKVRAVPGSSRERIVGILGDALKVAVQAPPERGRANERIAAVLADALGLTARAIELLSGPASREKRFLLRTDDVATIRARLEALVSA